MMIGNAFKPALAASAIALLLAGCAGEQPRNEDFDREVNADAGQTGRVGSRGGRTENADLIRETPDGTRAPDGDDEIQDFAGMLDASAIRRLERQLERIEDETGQDIHIVLKETIDGENSVQHAHGLLSQGDADILLLGVDDAGDIAIVTSPQLGNTLTVEGLTAIVNSMAPHYQRAGWAGVFEAASDAVADELRGSARSGGSDRSGREAPGK